MSLVNMDTEVVVQVNKRKKMARKALVVEAFNQR